MISGHTTTSPTTAPIGGHRGRRIVVSIALSRTLLLSLSLLHIINYHVITIRTTRACKSVSNYDFLEARRRAYHVSSGGSIESCPRRCIIIVIIYSCNVISAHDYRDHPRRLSRRRRSPIKARFFSSSRRRSLSTEESRCLWW